MENCPHVTDWHMHPRALLPGIICVIVVALVAACQAPQAEAVAGKDGIGDPYYPQMGNSGYDVTRYILVLNVDPPANSVEGETRIEAQALERLKSFNLDFLGLSVDSVTVNDAPAAFSRQDGELTVAPGQTLPVGPFVTVIRYHGQPEPAPAATSPNFLHGAGWFHSQDGTINVMGELNGAPTWYPVNNHPRDKATYRFEITVPKPWVVAANGVQKETVDRGAGTRYVYEMDRPMASYLATINIDRYEVETSQGPDGVTLRYFFPPGFREDERRAIRLTPEIMSYYAGFFGAYPFGQSGIAVTNAGIAPCQSGGVALESQTLTVVCPSLAGDDDVIAHELAHHWFGDSVSLKYWQDLWLKEGLATYAEWMWQTREQGAQGVHQVATDENTPGRFLASKVGVPPPDDLYGLEQFEGGAVTIHALRLQVGDDAFFKILRTYLERYRYGNAGTSDFVALAEEISGQKLGAFFDSWLLAKAWPEFPAGRAP